MKIVSPFEPRIGKDLESWHSTYVDIAEIDRNVVQDVDFAGATRINADVSRIEGSILTGLSLDKFEMSDVVAVKLEAAALQAYKTRMLRVEVSDSRLTGSEFAEGSFEDCVFRNVKFDEAGFRFARFKRVRFVNCMLRKVDFSNAKFEHVTFIGCDLEETNFVSAECKSVDVTTEDLATVKGLLGLKGATISTEQLMQLAPLLASELGFHVEDAA
jgi:uncharacterized protein YjbI with pentapeptide repeats